MKYVDKKYLLRIKSEKVLCYKVFHALKYFDYSLMRFIAINFRASIYKVFNKISISLEQN